MVNSLTSTKQFKFQSNQEFYNALSDEIEKYQRLLSRKRIGTNLIIASLLAVGEFSVLKTGSSKTYFIPDYDKQEYTSELDTMINHVLRVSKQYELYGLLTSKDIERIFEVEVLDDRLVEEIVLPPSHLIKCKSGIFNLNTMLYEDTTTDKNGKRYFFPHTYNFDVKAIQEINPEYISTMEAIHDRWSINDPIKLKFIKTTLLSCLCGLDIHRQIVIEGTGGNGKSTFLDECKAMAGPVQYLDINLHDYDTNSIFELIRPYHKLLAGDDLTTNWVMNGLVTTRFKQLVMGKIVYVDRKYKDALAIQHTGMRIQLTNDFMRLIERGSAIEDRLLFVQWTSDNFREVNTDIEVDELRKRVVSTFGASLDVLVNSSLETNLQYEYYTALVSWLLDGQYRLPVKSDFDEFVVAFNGELKQAMSDSGDVVDDFIADCESGGVFKQRVVPVTLLYLKYCDYVSIHNPGAKPMRTQLFTARLKPILKENGYDVLNPYRQRFTTAPFSECHIREYSDGLDLMDLSPNDKRYKAVKSTINVFRKNNAKNFLDGFTPDEQVEKLNELAALNGMKDTELYSLPYSEIEKLYNATEL